MAAFFSAAVSTGSGGLGGALAVTVILPPGPMTSSSREPVEPTEEPLLSAGVLFAERRPPGAEAALPGREGERRLRSPPALPGRILLLP